MGKVDKKLQNKNSSKSKEKDSGLLLSKATSNLAKSSGKENIKDVISDQNIVFSKPDVLPSSNKNASEIERATVSISNKEKKRMERREARSLKLHARGVEKRKKNTKNVAKKVFKGKLVDDLISTDLVTKSQLTVEKSKKIKGRRGRKHTKNKTESLEECLTELGKVDLDSTDNKPTSIGNKKARRKQKRQELLSKLHGGIEKKKKKVIDVKKIVHGKSVDAIQTLIDDIATKSDLATKSALKEVKPKKVNPKTKDHKDRRVGYEAFMDVHNDPEYQKNPFDLISRAIREGIC